MARARAFPYEHGFTPDWRGWPPHMVANERSLLFWYLSNVANDITQIWYDVPFDGEDAATAHYPAAAQILSPTMLRTWYTLNARRADAITYDTDKYRILELRDKADAQTLGETLIYQRLAVDEWPELRWDAPAIISRGYAPGTVRAARSMQLVTFTAPPTLYDPANVEVRYVPSARA